MNMKAINSDCFFCLKKQRTLLGWLNRCRHGNRLNQPRIIASAYAIWFAAYRPGLYWIILMHAEQGQQVIGFLFLS